MRDPNKSVIQNQLDHENNVVQQVAQWANDIQEQQPDVSRDEALRIAEKWLTEVN